MLLNEAQLKFSSNYLVGLTEPRNLSAQFIA